MQAVHIIHISNLHPTKHYVIGKNGQQNFTVLILKQNSNGEMDNEFVDTERKED